LVVLGVVPRFVMVLRSLLLSYPIPCYFPHRCSCRCRLLSLYLSCRCRRTPSCPAIIVVVIPVLCSRLSSSFHPPSTPRAVAREAGGGWCRSGCRLVVPPCFPPSSSSPLPLAISLPLVVGWCSSSSPSSFRSLARRPPRWFVPALVVPPCFVLPAPQSLAHRIHPVSSCSRRWWGCWLSFGHGGRSWVLASWCFRR
jgi:hypothetical protein